MFSTVHESVYELGKNRHWRRCTEVAEFMLHFSDRPEVQHGLLYQAIMPIKHWLDSNDIQATYLGNGNRSLLLALSNGTALGIRINDRKKFDRIAHENEVLIKPLARYEFGAFVVEQLPLADVNTDCFEDVLICIMRSRQQGSHFADNKVYFPDDNEPLSQTGYLLNERGQRICNSQGKPIPFIIDRDSTYTLGLPNQKREAIEYNFSERINIPPRELEKYDGITFDATMWQGVQEEVHKRLQDKILPQPSFALTVTASQTAVREIGGR